MTDYISRQAAIDELAKKYYDTQNDYIMAVQVIERLPTADIRENVRGERRRSVTAFLIGLFTGATFGFILNAIFFAGRDDQ